MVIFSDVQLYVMVVDDEEELANLFCSFLETLGFYSISFTDPLLALEYFSKNYEKYSLVITDLKMPGLDGIQLANKMREYNKTIKILMITAFIADQGLKDDAFKNAQIFEVIEKPIRFKELGQRITQLLSI